MQDVYGLIDKLQETHALFKEEWVQVLENRNAAAASYLSLIHI